MIGLICLGRIETGLLMLTSVFDGRYRIQALVGGTIVLGLISLLMAQILLTNGWYVSSRCGTQEYRRWGLFWDLSESDYDEWGIGRQWEIVHRRPCISNNRRAGGELFRDWLSLNRAIAKQQPLDSIKSILSGGVAVGSSDPFGRSALHWAHVADQSAEYRRELISMLIDAGFDAGLMDENGLTPVDRGQRFQSSISGN